MMELVAPRFLDGLLVFMLVERLVLGRWLVRQGQSRLVGLLGAYLLSGAALIAAVRLALVDETSGFVALPLLVSLIAHVGFLVGSKRLVVPPVAAPPLERRSA